MKNSLLSSSPIRLALLASALAVSSVLAGPDIPNGNMIEGEETPFGWSKPWQSKEDAAEPAKLTLDKEEFVSEPASLKLTSNSETGQVSTQLVVTESPEGTVAAETFTVSGQVKFSGNSTGIAVVAITGLGPDWKQTFRKDLTSARNAGSKWTSFSTPVTLPDGLKRVLIEVSIVEGEGTVWVDDLKTED